jgi:hypothetical protein
MHCLPLLSEQKEQQARRRLWLLGFASIALYGAVFVLSSQFHYGEGHEERPILEVLAILGLATVAYFGALAVVFRLGSHPKEETRLLYLVLGFSIAFRLVLWPSTPIQEIDFYRYLWDGRVCLGGHSPFQFSPAQIEGAAGVNQPVDAGRSPEAEALWRLSQRSAVLKTIFERMHHREVPTVYPPAAQAVFALAALLTPASAPLFVQILVLKTLLLSFDIATLFLLVALLRRLGLPAIWGLAYGWCPLAVKEIANSGHLDSIAVLFCTLALYLLAGMVTNKEWSWKNVAAAVAGMAALGVAVLAKSYPIILVPMIAAYVAGRVGWRVVFALVAFGSVVAAGYVPFFVGRSAGTYDPLMGLRTFLTRWQMNDFLCMLVHENLRNPDGHVAHWFVVVPASWRGSLDDWFRSTPWSGWLPAGVDPAFVLAQLVMGILLLSLIVRWAWRIYRQPEPELLMRCTFLTLAWGWLLSSAQNPWYLLWCLPFMAFARRGSWFLLLGLALLYYLRFWLEYQEFGDDAAVQAARDRFDFGVVWLEYLPFFVALVVESVYAAWSGSRTDFKSVPRGHRAESESS